MDNKFQIAGRTFDEERSLYGLHDLEVDGCSFTNSDIAESPLKECVNLTINNSLFDLRYAVWHGNKVSIFKSHFTEKCRAPLWYCSSLAIDNSIFDGPKALRESNGVSINKIDAKSDEFGWKCNYINGNAFKVEGEYPFFMCSNFNFNGLSIIGKYSFQYCSDSKIDNSYLDTKDAFWHCKNITISNSVIKGEYIGWYSRNLKFVNCRIIGTQPFCYTEGLVLENCELMDANLAFEYSFLIKADLKGHVVSIKNPISGQIVADSVGEIIYDKSKYKTIAEIKTRQEKEPDTK